MRALVIWPHGFDLSFEWFGTRVERFEENGEVQEYPSQLNLGFYPTGDAYFYSNPWPFDESLPANELPHGAVWNTDGWQGTKLDYADLVGDPDAAAKVETMLHERLADGAAIMLVTHDTKQAERMASKHLRMESGALTPLPGPGAG